MEENTQTSAATAPSTGGSPAPATGGAPSAPSAEPTPQASAQPTPAPAPAQASAQASAQPAPEPRPSPDAFQWDAWDGNSWDAFPEDIRPWAERLHGHLNTSWEKQRQTLEEKARETAARAEKYKNYWESALAGVEEDPRLIEYDQQRQQAQAAAEAAQQEVRRVREWAEQMVEAETQRYWTWAVERAGGEQAVKSLLTGVENEAAELAEAGYEPHNIFDIARLGPEAMKAALGLAKDGVKENYALRLLKAEYGDKLSPSKTETAPAAPVYSAAAQAVAGAKPTPRPEPPAPTPITHLSMADQRALAAKRAVANYRK